jgi:hypothetical protein
MKLITKRVTATLASTLITGCVFKEPYPKQWADIYLTPGDCPDISGVFNDEGRLDPKEVGEVGEGWLKRSLSRLLLTDKNKIETVSHVEINQLENGGIKVTAWNENKPVTEQRFSKRNGDFTCKTGFVEFVGEKVCETGNGIMACATPETDLIKNNEGALIVKTNSRGFGAVYLIPVYVSEWHWYRFLPLTIN